MVERVLNGADAGTIEDRDRWWMVAVSKGFAEGLSLASLPEQERRYANLGEALEPIAADDPMWAPNTYLADKAERDKAAGKGFTRQFVGPESETIGTIGRGYAKRRSTEPFLKREDGMERILSPREHARVKGTRECLVEDLSATLAHEILGQSILHGHAKALGQRIAEHLVRVCAQDDEQVVADVPAPAPSRGVAPR